MLPPNFCGAIYLNTTEILIIFCHFHSDTYVHLLLVPLTFCVKVSRCTRRQQWTVATAVVGGGSGDITAADVGGRQQWTMATAAGIDVHGGDSSGRCFLGDSSSGDCSRGANTNTLHFPHLTFFYTQAFVIHTRAHVPLFQPTCRNSLTAQHGCYVSTMHVERTGVTGTSTEPSCPG